MSDGLRKLNALWARGQEFLGSKYAILGGAMSWVSERNLVSAISNAGGFGVIACGGMNPDQLSKEIAATAALTDKPFGVNIVTLHPQIMELIEVCRAHNTSHVVLAGGVPSSDMLKGIKDFEAKIMCFAPTAVFAKKLVRMGADAIIIEGSEAGGHIGPVSTNVLAQEILPVVRDVPVFVAGGLGKGHAIASFLEMGASGAQLGTRFVTAEECIAHEKFKKAFIRGNARDAVSTVQVDPNVPVIPVRALKNEGTSEFMDLQHDVVARYKTGALNAEGAQLEIEKFWVGALRRAVIDGDVERGSVMAGQSVGMVKTQAPTKDIINELVSEAVAYLDRGDRITA